MSSLYVSTPLSRMSTGLTFPFYKQGKKNVEVRPAHTNKGEIVKRLLYQYPEAEFCMCAGDDKTDEDMVSFLPFPQPNTTCADFILLSLVPLDGSSLQQLHTRWASNDDQPSRILRNVPLSRSHRHRRREGHQHSRQARRTCREQAGS